MVLATPVLAMSLLLIVAERAFGLPVFDAAHGGDPVLFQHLFWFYSHPAVYIMILPAMGVVSEVFACFARRQVFGYGFMIFSMMAHRRHWLSRLGHHMFVAGQSQLANLIFSFLSFICRAIGDQGVQLDGDALSRPDRLRSADAVCIGLSRPVHHRW